MSTVAAKSFTGLPEALPQGEVVLWQGKPSWHSLAVRAFHMRKVGIYFGLILAWRTVLAFQRKEDLVQNIGPLLLLAVAAICISALLALLYSGTTTYTITNRRVFMRFGAALPMMLNLPFRIVGSAAVRSYSDGTADIPLQLIGPGRVAYLHLWPNARPWRLKHPEPMLRSIPDGARVAALLASALTLPVTPASQALGTSPAESAKPGVSPAPADLASAAA